MTRKCIVILNLSNFTGTVNHFVKDGEKYKKLRVDYSEMLKYIVSEDRELLGAYVVSQQDLSATNKTVEQLQANQKFVQNLKKFGWMPIRVSYDSKTNDMSQVFDTVWQSALSPHVNENREFTINPATTDVVFINGSASWFDLLNSFFQIGFQVEVAYPKTAVSNLLTANFAFLDMTQFLLKNNKQTS